MSLPDTLLINGTDLRSIPRLIIRDISGLLTEAPYRGDNETIPGMPGEVGTVKVAGAFTFDIPVTLLGTTRADFLSILASVRALASTNLVTLTRRLSTSGGYADTSCAGEYLAGTAVEMLAFMPAAGRTTLSFRNLDGGWA